MRLTVVHETSYRYESEMVQSTLLLRLTPPTLPGQQVVAWRLQAEAPLTDAGLDGFGNAMHLLTCHGRHEQVSVKAFGTVDTDSLPIRSGDALSPLLFLRHSDLTLPDTALADFAGRFEGRIRTPARLRDLSAAVHAGMGGDLPAMAGGQHAAGAAEAWARGSGGSAEQAQVLVSVCRELGLPARHVSGYVLAAHASGLRVSSHAWAEVWLADAWHSADVALQCQAGERHVRLALGRDALDTCAMRSMGQGSLHAGSVVPVAGRGDETLARVMAMQQQQQ